MGSERGGGGSRGGAAAAGAARARAKGQTVGGQDPSRNRGGPTAGPVGQNRTRKPEQPDGPPADVKAAKPDSDRISKARGQGGGEPGDTTTGQGAVNRQQSSGRKRGVPANTVLTVGLASTARKTLLGI